MVRGRKGYFFVVDAIIASTVLLFGVFLLFGSAIRATDQTQPLSSAEDFAAIILNTPMSGSQNQYYLTMLLPQNIVAFPDATPLEEVGYLIIKWNQTSNITYLSHAENFTESLIDSLDSRFGVAVYFNGTRIADRAVPETTVRITRPILLFIRMNESAVIGPVTGEVWLWY